jgi:hypothetical protein
MKRDKMRKDRGVGLLVLIIVIAFLLSVGILLLFVTGTGPEVANNVRLQERAFNAAEAGFDEAWRAINDLIVSATWADFAGQYRKKYSTYGDVLDFPGTDATPNPYFFRSVTDAELVADMTSDNANTLYVNQPLPNDSTLSFTVFLIDDENITGATVNDRDCIVVCIGRAGQNTYARIEVVIEIQTT